MQPIGPESKEPGLAAICVLAMCMVATAATPAVCAGLPQSANEGAGEIHECEN
ncbi:hypothetical protein [Microcystis phage vB_MaeS-yong1]|nr:hypothetical protein [Microcystis phage vB_MaeS-yong1]